MVNPCKRYKDTGDKSRIAVVADITGAIFLETIHV